MRRQIVATQGGGQLDCSAITRLLESIERHLAMPTLLGQCRDVIRLSVGAESFRRAAFQRYIQALETLVETKPHVDEAVLPRFRLLVADIAFRIRLISLGEDFWATGLLATPSIPPLHLDSMRRRVSLLETLGAEIVGILDRMDDASLRALELAATTAVSAGEVRAALPTAERVAVLRREAEQRIATASSQIQLVQARQVALEREQGQVKSELASIRTRIGAQITSAVGSYLGLPPEMALAAGPGNLEDRFRQYVGSRAGEILSDQDLLGSFEALGDGPARFVDAVREVQDQYRNVITTAQDARSQFERYRRQFEEIRHLLHEPTTENLARMGSRVLSLVAPKEAEDLRRGVCNLLDGPGVRPVRALLQTARQPGAVGAQEVRRVMAMHLADARVPAVAIDAAVRSIMGEAARAQRLTIWLGDLLRAVGDRAQSGAGVAASEYDVLRSEVARIVVSLSPRQVLETIPPQLRAEIVLALKRQMGVATDAEVIDRLARGFDQVNVPLVEVRRNQVVLIIRDNAIGGERVIQIVSWRSLADLIRSSEAFEADAAQVRRRLELLAARILRAGFVRDLLLEQVPFDRLEAGLDEIATRAGALDDAWAALRQGAANAVGADCDRPGPAMESLVRAQVGRRISTEVQQAREAEGRGNPIANSPLAPTSTGGAQGGGQDLGEQMALRAADVLFPGAGTAIQTVASIWSGIEDFNAKAQRMNDIAREADRLVQHQAQLEATVRESRTALELARLDGEVADARRAAALAQLDALTRASQSAGGQVSIGLQRIQRRLPLFFYTAEKLREEYDLLDRAVAVWGPEGGTIRDALRRLAESDPQNTRLALDSDIDLFSWFDREVESVRTDVDRTVAHWRQLLTIATDVCERIGCIPGRTRLAHVQQTRMFDVCALMSQGDCQALREWLKKGGIPGAAGLAPFDATISVPLNGELIQRHLLNVRLIDIRIGGYESGSGRALSDRKLGIPSAEVMHPGLSFVRTAAGFSREAFAPSVTASFDWPDTFDLEALATRWAAGARPARRVFEGYGAYAALRLRVNWSSDLARLDPDGAMAEGSPAPGGARSGILMRIAYSYHLPSVGHEPESRFAAAPLLNSHGRPSQVAVHLPGQVRSGADYLRIPDDLISMVGGVDAVAAWLRPVERTIPDCEASAAGQRSPEAPNGMLARLCLRPIPQVDASARQRGAARSLVEMCLPTTALVRPGDNGSSPQLKMVAFEQQLRTTYAVALEAAADLSQADGLPLSTRSLNNEAGYQAISSRPTQSPRDIKTAHDLCGAIRRGDQIRRRPSER